MSSQGFGTGLWGGSPPVTSPLGSASPVSSLITAALRIAGITLAPGRTPSPEQFAEAIPTLNRMLASWSINRLDIYTIDIVPFTLTPGKKIYTIGVDPTGQKKADFAGPRPVLIERASIIFGNPINSIWDDPGFQWDSASNWDGTPGISTPIRRPIELIDDEQWQQIRVQDIPQGLPSKLYDDYSYPLSNLYFWTQPALAYQVELYYWHALPTFATLNDAVVLPPGYERAITFNLAREIAAMYPTNSHMAPMSYQIAKEALEAIETVNAPTPRLQADEAVINAGRRSGGRPFNYLTGGF